MNKNAENHGHIIVTSSRALSGSPTRDGSQARDTRK